jgi:DNA-directed RNA polymerase III subunit RPC1
MIKMAPEKVVPVVPQIILSVRMALNTRIPDVMRRTIIALTQLAKADVTSSSNDPSSPESKPKIANALVPYFRQILPVLNIFAQRYMSKKMGIDDEKRGVRKVEDLIQELLNTLELYGGENAYLNIRYVVPSYTSVLAVL